MIKIETKQKAPTIALITIIHDKYGSLIIPLKKVIHRIEEYYPSRYVAVSDETCPDIIELLGKHGFGIFVIEKNGAANARRKLVQIMSNYEYDFYHYCDLDRFVTWMLDHSSELPSIQKDIINYHYLVIGRTEVAFQSHPISWQETEKITNHMFSLEVGSEMDITAGSCSMSREALLEIAVQSSAKMTDGEWPLIARNKFGKENIGYYKVDGLKYLEHNKANMKDEVEEWCTRVRLSHIICQSIMDLRRDS
ncbi:hypothetical protein [Ornithinibacillus sp. 179-J 7C1 HS]|uniref:hypothetical protein n=1 Tax=Ornithinibacillus sp. 179-J 7C1 HS TaxID=3142384 RepID=UPI0039A3F276